MNKFVELLEKYCEWIAISLGGLFLIWVLWAYILFTPVGVEVKEKSEKVTLVPGTVDSYVNKMQAAPLEQEMNDPSPPTPPTRQLAIYPPWLHQLQIGDMPLAVLPAQWPSSLPQDVAWHKEAAPEKAQVLVQALPVLPPAPSLDVKAARAFVAPPAPAVNGVVPPPQPAAPGMAVAGHDISYVRLTYSIVLSDIDAAFKKVNIPPQVSNTSILETKLYRQEQMPDGSWSPAIEVPPLATGATIQPLPPAGALPAAVAPFRTWAESDQGQSDLLRPAFYQVLSGEGPWDQAVDDVMATAANSDAAKAAAEAQRLASEKQKQDEAERLRAAAAARASRPSSGTTPPRQPRPTTPRRTKPSGIAQDESGPSSAADLAGLQLAQANPDGGFMGADRARPPGMPGYPGAPMPGMPGGMPGMPRPNPAAIPSAVPGGPAVGANGLPAAPLNPAGQPPIIGWAYDETVKEGHTYRYQVVYSIRNPVYDANANIVAKPALAAVFAISSFSDPLDEKSWSQPVTVKPTTEFYLAGPNWPSSNLPSTIRVYVFKWANGKWQQQTFAVAPGDRIGTEEGKVDYQTNDTLVDVRYDTRQGHAYVLVLGPDGQLTERAPETDKANPRLKLLQQAAAPPVVPGAPGAAPAAVGGQPPMPPMPGGPGMPGAPGMTPPRAG